MTKRRQPAGPVVAAPLQVLPVEAPRPASYAPALNTGFQATTSRVQEMHHAIAGKTFDGLLAVPGLAMPTRLVKGVHDAITQGVYAAVRQGGGALFGLAGTAERLFGDASELVQGKESSWRSALNGAFGDSFAGSGSALAITMGLFDAGLPLALTPEALRHLPTRLGIFLHGLGCDEQSWGLFDDAWNGSRWATALEAGERACYGALLEHEFGVGSVYLRYNTGLAIEANAQRFAEMVQQLANAAPQVTEIVLIGHSMGGLVARLARELAEAHSMRWPQRARLLICLGSPHRGAPLEQLGHAAAALLGATSVTEPLGRIANARSQGVKDLRHGLRGAARPAVKVPTPVALRLVAATLHDEGDGALGSFFGQWLGDGLVRAESAAEVGLGGDVQRVELSGLGHMALLNHPRVYAVLRTWLGAPEIA